MKDLEKVLKAASDRNRLRILKLLETRNMCVCELQAVLGLAQPTVSKHLKVLEEAGLVYFTKNGLWVNYDLSDGSSSPYAANLLGNLKYWLEDDPEIAERLRKLPFVCREEVCKR